MTVLERNEANLTPEFRAALVQAIEVAIYPPMKGQAFAARVPWSTIGRLREALDVAGIDWRAVKAETERKEAARLGGKTVRGSRPYGGQ